jgi:hypothetical protein
VLGSLGLLFAPAQAAQAASSVEGSHLHLGLIAVCAVTILAYELLLPVAFSLWTLLTSLRPTKSGTLE